MSKPVELDHGLVVAAQRAHGVPHLVHDIQAALAQYRFYVEADNLEKSAEYASKLRKLLTSYQAVSKGRH